MEVIPWPRRHVRPPTMQHNLRARGGFTALMAAEASWRRHGRRGRRLVKLSVAAVITMALAFVPTTAHSRAGDLDRSFGRGGMVKTPAQDDPFVAGLARYDDGRLLVLSQFVGSRPQLIGYRANGRLDAAFGRRGRVLVREAGRAMVTLPSGGSVHVGYNSLVRRLRDGSYDESFGSEGRVTPPLPMPDDPERITRSRDGRLVVSGSRYFPPQPGWCGQREARYYPTVARFLPSGTLDRGFGGDGQVTTIREQSAEVVDHVVQPDGKVVALIADNSCYAPFATISLLRYRANGTLDRGFGTRGEAKVGGDPAKVGELALARNGRIVVSAGSGYNNTLLARFLPDGSPDRTFGEGGRVLERFRWLPHERGLEYAKTLALARDGRIFVGGPTRNPLDFGGFFIAGFTSRGSVDRGFGRRGVVFTRFDRFDAHYVHKILLQPDGRLVAAGAGTNPFVLLARYHIE